MNKTAVFNHFSRILNDTIDSNVFFKYFLQDPYWFDGVVCIDESIGSLRFNHGATRGCLIDDDYDYVVKFDLEDNGVGSACAQEVEIYQRASKCGMADYLCEAVYLGTFTKTFKFYSQKDIDHVLGYTHPDGWDDFEGDFMEEAANFGAPYDITITLPLYGYPKAAINKTPHCPSYTQIKREIAPIRSPLSEYTDVGVYFTADWGLEGYVAFGRFCEENAINDLRMENVGWQNGKVVLLDYAGFHDEL